MNTPESPVQTSYRLQGIINRWAGQILVVGMMVCLGGVVSALLARLLPYWHPLFLPAFAGLLALEAMLSEHRMRRTIDLDISVGVYLFIEWVMILLALRIFSYLGLGFEGLQESLSQLGQAAREGYFLEQLFDIAYLISLLPVLSIWGLTRSYVANIRALQGEEVLLAIENDAIISNRGAIRQQIANQFLMVGTILVILVGIINMDIGISPTSSLLPWRSTSGPQTGGFWLVAYFAQGLLLLSLAHQSALRAAWAWERIPIDERISMRWVGLSGLLLGIALLVAFILPADYTVGLSATLNYILGWLLTIIYALMFFILYPLFIALVQFLRLVGMNGVETMIRPEMPVPPTPPPALEQQPAPGWVAMLQSALFWTLLIGIVLYALIMYVRQNQALMNIFRRVPGWRLLLQAVHWVRERLQNARKTVGGLVTAGRQGIQRLFQRVFVTPPGMPALRLGRLDPRQQVRFYYLALLRRSAEAAHPRRPDETPAEYAERLAVVFAQADGGSSQATRRKQETSETESAGTNTAKTDIAAMTATYIEARYTTHPIDSGQLQSVRHAWAHLRRLLRIRFRKEK